MSKVKSFSVGNGDMFYINHDNSNFTIIDCYLKEENKDRIIKELKEEWKNKDIIRFISTHPDEDHILGIKDLYKNDLVINFYCVENNAKKDPETESFKYYCELRNRDETYHLTKECSRQWMNLSGNDRNGKYIGSSGINILWPDTNNKDFKAEKELCENYGNDNNISPIIKYSTNDEITFIWFGDLETTFFEKIENEVKWCEADIIFAPHHGRKSGALPKTILEKINPKIIIVGEAPSEDLEYYRDYNTITQNSSGDIIFDCNRKEIDIYCSKDNYSVKFLKDYKKNKYNNYIGTLDI